MTAAERTYFELLDACGRTGCVVCTALRAAVSQRIEAEAATIRGIGGLLIGACSAHAERVAAHVREHQSSLRQLLAYLRAACPGGLPPQQRWWLLRRRPGDVHRCLLCGVVERRETLVVPGLLRALREMQFVRAFRVASPLCLAHAMRAAAIEGDGAAECAEIQRAKLAVLDDQLLRHDAVRDDQPAVDAALRYLAPEETASRYGTNETKEGPADPAATPAAASGSFEVSKLKHEVEELTRRLGDAESRAAGLHYRVAVLSAENRDWEMRYTGLASHARTLEADLRAARAKGT